MEIRCLELNEEAGPRDGLLSCWGAKATSCSLYQGISFPAGGRHFQVVSLKRWARAGPAQTGPQSHAREGWKTAQRLSGGLNGHLNNVDKTGQICTCINVVHAHLSRGVTYHMVSASSQNFIHSSVDSFNR